MVVVEVTVEAGIVGGQVLELDCVIVAVTVEGAGHVLEVRDVEVELVVETEEEELQPVTNPPILATTHPTDLAVDEMLGHVVPELVTEIVLVVVAVAVVVWLTVTSCVFVVVSVVVFVVVLKSVWVEVFATR
jgi:hypothetical protein